MIVSYLGIIFFWVGNNHNTAKFSQELKIAQSRLTNAAIKIVVLHHPMITARASQTGLPLHKSKAIQFFFFWLLFFRLN
jgi:hypothetical protein